MSRKHTTDEIRFYPILNILGTLTLEISSNPYFCGERMQWMRIGDRDGWLTVHLYNDCINFPGQWWKKDLILPGNIIMYVDF